MQGFCTLSATYIHYFHLVIMHSIFRYQVHTYILMNRLKRLKQKHEHESATIWDYYAEDQTCSKRII